MYIFYCNACVKYILYIYVTFHLANRKTKLEKPHFEVNFFPDTYAFDWNASERGHADVRNEHGRGKELRAKFNRHLLETENGTRRSSFAFRKAANIKF